MKLKILTSLICFSLGSSLYSQASFRVTNPADTTDAGTLRAAMINANSNVGHDSFIEFAIPSNQAITLLSPLPNINIDTNTLTFRALQGSQAIIGTEVNDFMQDSGFIVFEKGITLGLGWDMNPGFSKTSMLTISPVSLNSTSSITIPAEAVGTSFIGFSEGGTVEFPITSYNSSGLTISSNKEIHFVSILYVENLLQMRSEGSTALFSLSNTDQTANYWRSLSLEGVDLLVTTPNSFSTTGTVTASTDASPSSITFNMPGETFTGSSDFDMNSNGRVSVIDGTINLTGDISNVLEFSAQGGEATISGGFSNSSIRVIQQASLTLEGILKDTFLEITDGNCMIKTPDASISSLIALTIDPEEIGSASVEMNIESGSTLEIGTLSIDNRYGELDLAIFNSGWFSAPRIELLSPLLTFKAPILSGTGGLWLGGAGRLHIGNPCIFTGDTVVSGSSTLLIGEEGSINTPDDTLTVGPLATFENNGLITVFEMLNNGRFTGSGHTTILSPTTLTNNGTILVASEMEITGNVLSTANSRFVFNLLAGEEQTLTINGDLTIDPGVTAQFTPAAGEYSRFGESYFLLNYDSITGFFDTFTMDSALLSFQTLGSDTAFALTVLPSPLVSVATTGNANRVGGAMDALIADGNTAMETTYGTFIPLNASQVVSSLNQLQPSTLKALAVSQESSAVKVRDSLSLRLNRELDAMHCMQKEDKNKEKTPCDVEAKPFHAWVNGMGNALHQDRPRTYDVGYQNNMGGVAAGMDYHFCDLFYVGALGAYTDADLKWKDSQGKGTVKSGYAGLYFSALSKMFYANASVTGAWSHYTAKRNINLLTGTSTASNKHGGAQILSHIDTGINLGWGGFTVRPFDSFDYISGRENSFTETGADSFNLSVKKNNTIMLRNELGLNFSSCFCLQGVQWTISPKISWVREVRVKGEDTTAKFAGTSEEFTVTGFFPSRSLVSPGISISGNMLDDLLTIGLYYSGEFKGNYSNHSYGGQVRFGF